MAVSDNRTIDADGRCRTPVGDTFDEKIFGTRAAEQVKRKQQERAYTSPIWYTPDV